MNKGLKMSEDAWDSYYPKRMLLRVFYRISMLIPLNFVLKYPKPTVTYVACININIGWTNLLRPMTFRVAPHARTSVTRTGWIAFGSSGCSSQISRSNCALKQVNDKF